MPGVDEVIRKVLALLGGERGVRLLFQGNAVRVGPTQFPRLWHLHTEVTTTFDWPDVPELYVSQTPFFNAGAYGIDKPFIVVHSAAIELLDDDELRVLLAHELGHVMSGHALYRTIAAILALISLGALPMLASLAVLPVRLAFLEWSRKSELSADRAGLLGGAGHGRGAAAGHEDGRRRPGRGVRGAAQRGRLHAAGPRVRRQRRGARRRVQDAEHARADPPDAHRARRRAAAVGQLGRVRPDPARRVRAARDRDDRAADGRRLRGRGRTTTPDEAREIANQVADAARRAAERARDAFRNAQKP